MRLKKIEIQIKSLDEALDDFVKVAERIKSRKKIAPHKGSYVADAETARALFTEGRLAIIQLLRNRKPNSIYELAKLLKRDFKNVYDDVLFLSQLGIIGIEESSEGRRKKKPILLADRVLFKMAA